MSSMGKSAVVSRCHELLDMRNFTGCALVVKMNKQLGKDWLKLDQAEAICDVIIAAEKRLPNGFMDFYGMIQATRLGPVVPDDFTRLMNLLDEKENGFPSRQEASQHALQAWSMLSKPDIKASYDLAISGRGSINGYDEWTKSVEGRSYGGDESCVEESDGKHDGGDGISETKDEALCGGMEKGKEKVETFTRICTKCLVIDEYLTKDDEVICFTCLEVMKAIYASSEWVPFPPPEMEEERHNHRIWLFQLGIPRVSAFYPKQHYSYRSFSRGYTKNLAVVISDDEDDDDDQEIVTMARTAKLCKVNGRRVKLIPLKKIKKVSSTSNVKKPDDSAFDSFMF